MSSSGKSLQIDSKESSYLPHTRPRWVNQATEWAYSDATRSPDNYYFLGDENYEFREHGFLLKTNGVVPAYQQRHVSQIEINIGDIGSGGNQLANALNKKKGIRALGISAADYRRPEQHGIKDSTYILANAEKLSEIKEFQERDIIFSRYTFMHLADAAGSLCSAYSALKPGGILIIDIMSFYPDRDSKSSAALSFKGWHRDLIAYLRSEGYEVAAIQRAAGNNKPQSYAQDGYGLFAIVKTKDKLNLPMKYTLTRELMPGMDRFYVGECGGVSYSPSEDLIRFREKRRSEEKEADMKAIDNDLRDLLAKPEYLRLNPLEQAKTIKNIVKKMSSRQREDNLNQLDQHKEAAAVYNDIILKQTPHKLAICEQGHWSIDPEVALSQIKALAAFELVIEEERQEFDTLLVKHLGITLKESPVQNGRWRIAPILPTPFISVANEMELFKFIYKTERKAESGFFKTDFLKDKEELNPLELKFEVEAHCKEHPNGRAAQVWQLTQRLAANKPTLAELNVAIERLALRQSSKSLFRKLSPAARHEIVDADCRVEGVRFWKA